MIKAAMALLVVLMNPLYAQTTTADPIFKSVITGLKAGEGRYIREEGVIYDADKPGSASFANWEVSYRCVGNGTLWLADPYQMDKDDVFINENVTVTYRICQSLDAQDCEKIAVFDYRINKINKNGKYFIDYTPNQLTIDLSEVAQNYPTCSTKAAEVRAHEWRR